MAEKMDIIAEAFSRSQTGFTLSKAILEDYVKVVAKLKNVPGQEVKDRVQKRCNEIFEVVKDKQNTGIEEASRQS